MQCESAAAPTGARNHCNGNNGKSKTNCRNIKKKGMFLSSPTQCFFISLLQIREGKCYICSLDDRMVSLINSCPTELTNLNSCPTEQANLLYSESIRPSMSHRRGCYIYMVKTNAVHWWATSCRANITLRYCFKQIPWGTPKPCAKKVLGFRPGILAL